MSTTGDLLQYMTHYILKKLVVLKVAGGPLFDCRGCGSSSRMMYEEEIYLIVGEVEEASHCNYLMRPIITSSMDMYI